MGLVPPVVHVATRSASYAKPPQAVWALITDPAFMREHAGDVKTEVVESQPPRRLVTRIVGETAYGGTWTCEIAPTGGGCTLTITENGEVYNILFRFISRYVIGHYRTIDKTLAAIGKRLDAT